MFYIFCTYVFMRSFISDCNNRRRSRCLTSLTLTLKNNDCRKTLQVFLFHTLISNRFQNTLRYESLFLYRDTPHVFFWLFLTAFLTRVESTLATWPLISLCARKKIKSFSENADIPLHVLQNHFPASVYSLHIEGLCQTTIGDRIFCIGFFVFDLNLPITPWGNISFESLAIGFWSFVLMI